MADFFFSNYLVRIMMFSYQFLFFIL